MFWHRRIQHHTTISIIPWPSIRLPKIPNTCKKRRFNRPPPKFITTAFLFSSYLHHYPIRRRSKCDICFGRSLFPVFCQNISSLRNCHLSRIQSSPPDFLFSTGVAVFHILFRKKKRKRQKSIALTSRFRGPPLSRLSTEGKKMGKGSFVPL